ncbi:MAG: 2-hydroxy-3-oxopropionate reductase [Zoogloeaceae bacterium]|nr:2-hydroxy-3-oxopropionate reductase [Zoogloeaceae bacterium]
MNVGFIGLGLMGRPMALNLIRAGHSLRVWARRAEAMQPLLDAGASAGGSAADVAANVDVVITIVGDAPDVERVALGPDGIADGARPGLIHIDMSTISPEVTQSIAQRLRERGVTMLDAPVSGGEPGAINAALTIMVGGDASAFECVKPLFEAMGKTISHIGGNGAGQVAKACNQIVTGVGVAAVAEALNFARKSGVDAGAVREVLMGGFAASRILDAHGGRMVRREFAPGFKSWMHQKDMRIVLEEAHRLGLQLPTAAAAAQLYNAMVGSGLGEEDSVAMLKLFERMSGGKG